MLTPVKLTLNKNDPNPEIIDRLELLMKEAKAGEIQGMIYATVDPGGDSSSGWAGYFREIEMSGALMHVTARWYDQIRGE